MGYGLPAITKVTNNLKVMKIMKASGRTDREIAEYMGIDVKTFNDVVNGDDYIKEVYEKAQTYLVSEIENKFLENVMEELDGGNNDNAKWVLERLNPKYAKKEQVEISVKTIDDIIREKVE
jgi:hypothetical protein